MHVRFVSLFRLTLVSLLTVGCGASANDPGSTTGSAAQSSGPTGPSGTKPTGTKPTSTKTPASLALTPDQGAAFGSVEMGTSADVTARIVNSGQRRAVHLDPTIGAPFAFKGGDYPGTGGDCGSELAAESSCELALTFAPLALGAASDSLSIEYYDGTNYKTATIDLTGTGIAPSTTGGATGGATNGGTTSGGTTSGGTTTGGSTLDFAGSEDVDGGSTRELSVTIDATIAGIDISAVHVNPTYYVQVDEIKNPNGVVLASGYDTGTHKNRSYINNGAQGVQIPQTPDINNLFVPGTYTFIISVYDGDGEPASGTDVSVYVGKRKKSDLANKIDVNFFFSGSGGLTATSALTKPRFVAAVADFKALWANLGLTITNVRYYDIDSSYQTIVGETPSAGNTHKTMSELWSLGTGKPTGLNYFFVDSLDNGHLQPGYSLLGISGGIPGPSSLMNTTHSGVLVMYDSSTVVADDDLGATMAHEGGHYLGLWHNREHDDSLDNVSDTPSSTSLAPTNVMYWLADPSARAFTPMQTQIVKLNLLAY